MHRIYGLTDPRTGAIRYVGQTSQQLPARLYLHVWDSKQSGHKIRKETWICSLRVLGLAPGIVLLEETEDWRERERYWIRYGKEQGWDLLNHTDGGEGTTGYRHTPEARAKIAAANKLKAGRKCSPESVERIRQGQLGKKQTAATIESRIAPLRGRKDPPELREKKRLFQSSPEQRKRLSEAAKAQWARQKAKP